MRCDEVYAGLSYPDEHGLQCFRPKGHDAGPVAKHTGIAKNGRQLSWYTPAQKARRRVEARK